jgi:D-alanyl-lipoteichoic acid acyltransferase DltB (MBOAT superfamily)
MLFNTLSYVVFLSAVVAVFWMLPTRPRIYLLLAASLVFYALWRLEFVLLIVFSAFVDYYFSLKIDAESRTRWRRLWLICSLSTNLGLLLYFKYTYFILENAKSVGALAGYDWSFEPGRILLPLGISFYTFLSISYTVDVYRRSFEPIRSFSVYLTYVMFWPHMIAGPILRAHELIPQLLRVAPVHKDRLASAVRRILFGLFLKVGLADQIAPLVNAAFESNPAKLSALDVWTMAFGFGFQIYFDFAGYSMIAIGSAALLGVRFPQNFNWPYLATSPRDFWKRWHITLSAWIRDYLYLPLSGARFRDRSVGGLEIEVSRPGSVTLTAALFVTWFIMGLWHGANWTFALWGVWHAAFIWLYRLTAPIFAPLPPKIKPFLGWAVTLPVVMLSWIPFRAGSVTAALQLVAKVFDIHAYGHLSFRENFYLIIALIFVGMLLFYFVITMLRRTRSVWALAAVDTLATGACVFVVFIFLRPVAQFIYFQF